MSPITHINYSKLDKEYLLKYALELKPLAKKIMKNEDGNVSSDYGFLPDNGKELSKNDFNGLLIVDCINSHIQKILMDMCIFGKPMFLYVPANTILPEHIDNGVTASLNFVLTKDPSPVTIEGVDYTYDAALLDTSRLHSVNNGNNDRIILKISFFYDTYEEIKDQLKDFQ